MKHCTIKDEINNFGDGWSIEVQIPFVDPRTKKYRSPFAASPGVVDPAGIYHNDLVKEEDQLKNRKTENDPPNPAIPTDPGGYDYKNRPFGLSPEDSEAKTKFANPYPDRTDGRWVQQCLGGIVQAKALVTIESKLNNAGPAGYQQVWVTATQYMPQDKFAGSDQKQGV
jgi:hypothetical protein